MKLFTVTHRKNDLSLLSYSSRRYRVSPLQCHPAGRGMVLAYSQLNQGVHIISETALNLLLRCSTFATLREHAENITSALGTTSNETTEELTKYVSQGLLISEEDLIHPIDHLRFVPSKHRITSVVIPTRNRLLEIQRAVKSYLEDSQKYELPFRIVIADNSDEQQHCELVESLRTVRSTDREIWCIGHIERERFVGLLTDRDIPPDVVRYALFGHHRCESAIGANRNALLLETVNETVLSVDDDSVDRLVQCSNEQQNVLRFAAHDDAVDIRFFPDRESALQSGIVVNESVVAAHEQFIGRTLPELLAGYMQQGTVRFDDLCPHLVMDLKNGTGSIVMTQSGVLGDGGMDSPLSFLLPFRRVRERLRASETELKCALSSREIIMLAKYPTVSHSGPWLGSGVALDNGSLLPPFPSNRRGEDAVFGQIIRTCFSGRYFAHIPRALLHAPPGNRKYLRPHLLAFKDVLVGFVSAAASGSLCGTDHEKSLLRLGNYLIDLGSLSNRDLEEELRKLVVRKASLILTTLDIVSNSSAMSKDWKAGIDSLRSALVGAPEIDQIIPHDVVNESYPDALNLIRESIISFGRLLYWWQEIRDVVRWLRSKEIHLARRLA